MDCTFNVDYGNIGCKGGKVSATLTHVLDEGVEASETYPYTSFDNGTCLIDGKDIVQRIKNFIRLPSTITEDYLKDVLAALGPLIVGINGSSRAFQFYKSGVFFDEKCRKFVNHAVVSGNFRWNYQNYFKVIKNSFFKKICLKLSKIGLIIRIKQKFRLLSEF